jgi:hypothetical protein
MAAQIKVTSIKQLLPVSIPASVQIDFLVLGILPDIVQIYSSGVSAEPSNFVDKVDIDPPTNSYITIIELAAGSPLFIYLCPRTVTGGVLDDKMDDQSWETFCTVVPFTTRAPSGPPPTPKPLMPTISSIEPHQATLRSQGKIDVHWTGDAKFDLYHFMWMEQGDGWHEIEINSGGSSGVFTVSPVLPRRTYDFKVQGCISNLIGSDNCSPFCEPRVFVMPDNTHSLKEFLRLSNVPLSSGLRSLGEATFGAGLRAMMHL